MSDTQDQGFVGTKRQRIEQKAGQKHKKLSDGEEEHRSEAERQKLAQMSQLERETMIFEQEEKKREAAEIIELAKNHSMMSKKESALEDIKRRNAEKVHKSKEAEASYPPDNSGSDLEEEQHGVSEENSVHSDYDEREEHERADLKEAEITLEDLEKVRLSRDLLEKWVDQVYFESVVEHCFVRTTVAASKREQRYVMCQVAGVSEDPGNPYKLGKKQTTRLLKLKYGSSMKTVPMTHISNSPFTSAEFIQWKTTMNRDNVSLVLKSSIISKQEQIKEALEYQYKNDEIDYMLIKNRKERLEKAGENINIALELNEVSGQINHYKQQYSTLDKEKLFKKGNEDKLKKYHEMLEMLKEEKAMLEELKKKKYNSKQEVDAMQIFNENARLKQQELDSMAEIGKKEGKKEFNPFSRRNLQPENIWNTKAAGDLPIESLLQPETKRADAKDVVEAIPQVDRDEIRKKELTDKHKEVTLDIEIIDCQTISDKNVMIEGIFDLELDDNGPAEESEQMADILSFQEWKSKYYKA
eukprot:TRINITY_DN3584_c0_g7_i2.p1 TRINITY_DN3584_c0_g7~~TRINITY_DN3584_c0_g7_i2.p1  ORF type:complete len:527 (-),score=221.39 TRINITY_DN3584_c0_g7_i2:46-1626(-)